MNDTEIAVAPEFVFPDSEAADPTIELQSNQEGFVVGNEAIYLIEPKATVTFLYNGVPAAHMPLSQFMMPGNYTFSDAGHHSAAIEKGFDKLLDRMYALAERAGADPSVVELFDAETGPVDLQNAAEEIGQRMLVAEKDEALKNKITQAFAKLGKIKFLPKSLGMDQTQDNREIINRYAETFKIFREIKEDSAAEAVKAYPHKNELYVIFERAPELLETHVRVAVAENYKEYRHQEELLTGIDLAALKEIRADQKGMATAEKTELLRGATEPQKVNEIEASLGSRK